MKRCCGTFSFKNLNQRKCHLIFDILCYLRRWNEKVGCCQPGLWNLECGAHLIGNRFWFRRSFKMLPVGLGLGLVPFCPLGLPSHLFLMLCVSVSQVFRVLRGLLGELSLCEYKMIGSFAFFWHLENCHETDQHFSAWSFHNSDRMKIWHVISLKSDQECVTELFDLRDVWILQATVLE